MRYGGIALLNIEFSKINDLITKLTEDTERMAKCLGEYLITIEDGSTDTELHRDIMKELEEEK